MATKKEKSGGQRLSDAGRSLVWATFDDDEKSLIRQAAAKLGKPMSAFVSESAIERAKKIMAK